MNKILLLIFSTFLFYCTPPVQDEKTDRDKVLKEAFMRVNKHLVDKDVQQIRNYISRRNWKMNVSPSGLYYQVYQKGNGKMAQKNMLATINYKVELLDGTLCYSSDSLGPKTFLIGMGGVESGLEEGILLLEEGSSARFIMPPHLAHGLSGDQNKIKYRATIVYDVKLLNLQKKE